jgi:hypothetical protein
VVRLNRALTQRVRAMLARAAVTKNYWPEELATAVRIYNASLRLKNIKTPYELFHGNMPSVAQLRTLGS